jgi:hypothetical protein
MFRPIQIHRLYRLLGDHPFVSSILSAHATMVHRVNGTYEFLDDTVEDDTVVISILDMRNEILDCLGRNFRVELDKLSSASY